MDYPPNILHKIMFLCIGKGDAEQVQETLDWGADPHWCTKKRGTPAIVKATRGICAASGVVKVLLAAGADPNTTDADGCRAVDHVRRRLRFYEGKPRKPIRRSPSLTAGGRTKPAPARVEVHRASGARPPRRGRGLPARALQGRRARP